MIARRMARRYQIAKWGKSMRNRRLLIVIAICGVAAPGGCGGATPKASSERDPKTIWEKIGEAGDMITCRSLEEVSAAPLEKARALHLWGVLADDKAWARITAGNRLEAIGFRETEIAPEVFARLAHLPSLRFLTIHDCKIPQGAWAGLKGSGIEELNVVDMSFDDAALEAVGSMPRLRWLMIGCPKVTVGARDRFARAHETIKLTLMSW